MLPIAREASYEAGWFPDLTAAYFARDRYTVECLTRQQACNLKLNAG